MRSAFQWRVYLSPQIDTHRDTESFRALSGTAPWSHMFLTLCHLPVCSFPQEKSMCLLHEDTTPNASMGRGTTQMSGAGWGEMTAQQRLGEPEGTVCPNSLALICSQWLLCRNMGPQYVALWIFQGKTKIKIQISKYTVRANTVITKNPHLFPPRLQNIFKIYSTKQTRYD